METYQFLSTFPKHNRITDISNRDTMFSDFSLLYCTNIVQLNLFECLWNQVLNSLLCCDFGLITHKFIFFIRCRQYLVVLFWQSQRPMLERVFAKSTTQLDSSTRLSIIHHRVVLGKVGRKFIRPSIII